jgi:hypothetical protein
MPNVVKFQLTITINDHDYVLDGTTMKYYKICKNKYFNYANYFGDLNNDEAMQRQGLLQLWTKKVDYDLNSFKNGIRSVIKQLDVLCNNDTIHSEVSWSLTIEAFQMLNRYDSTVIINSNEKNILIANKKEEGFPVLSVFAINCEVSNVQINVALPFNQYNDEIIIKLKQVIDKITTCLKQIK